MSGDYNDYDNDHGDFNDCDKDDIDGAEQN